MSTINIHLKLKALILLTFGIFFLSTDNLQATHIVGGDMSFTCLGNDFYEVTLVIRRDCINGADDAPFDDPASVGIFDAFGAPLPFLGSLGQVLLPFASTDTVGVGRPECGFFGGPVCVEEATYKATVFLPFRKDGYILAYQRCCRNATLNNILDPLESGTTKFVCLTETTLNECNSSPEFQEWPDILICANNTEVFDHSAIDINGDSLAYHLYVPHVGATIGFPKPQPPSGPPYDSVRYAQGFSIDNLMGGDPLQIDENTGLITAVPNAIGQFLVGVLVEEWRDGELISKVRRDFEYNVRACEDIAEIDFEVDQELNCEGLTINTTNTSIDNFGFQWNFNFPSTDPQFLSNEFAPSFTYDEPGNYTISLTSADPANDCEVQVLQDVGVFVSELTGEIVCQIDTCSDGFVNLMLAVNAQDPNYDIDSYRWMISSEQSNKVYTGQNINVTVPCADEINIEVIVTSSNGCDITLNKTIDPNSLTLIDLVGDDGIVQICIGDSIGLLESIADGATYTWTPLEGLTFTDLVNFSDPIASPEVTTTYSVTATRGDTIETSSITVEVFMDPTYSVDSDMITICEGSNEQITITTEEGNTISWQEVDGLLLEGIYDPFNPGFRVGEDGGVFVYTISNGVCEVTDSIVVTAIPTEVDEVAAAIDTTFSYDSTSMSFMFSINESELLEMFDIVSIRWTVEAGGQTLSGEGSTIDIILPETDSAVVTYYFTDSQGCEYSVTYIIVINGGDDDSDGTLIDLVGDDGIVQICIGDSIGLLESIAGGATYTWTPLDGLTFTDLVNFSDPIASPEVTTTYSVTATRGDTTETSSITVEVFMDPIYSVESDTITICEGATEQISISSEERNTITWLEAGGFLFIDGIYDPFNPGFRVGENGGVFVYEISNGVCQVIDSIVVNAIPTEVDEVAAAIDTTFSYDSTSMAFMFSINESELLEMFDIVSIRWTVDAGGQTFEGTGGTIDLVLPDAETATVTYYFTDSQGCEYSVTYTVDLGGSSVEDVLSLEFIMNDTIQVCEGESSMIVANPNSEWTYTWDPEDFLVFASEEDKSNPTFVGDMTTTYIVSVTDGISTVTDTIVMEVINDLLDLSFEKEMATACFGEVVLFVQNDDHSSQTVYEWAFDTSFSNVIATEQFVTVIMPAETASVYVRAEDPAFCGSNVASIDIITIEPDFSFAFDSIDICESNETMVTFINNDPSVNFTIDWQASENIASPLDAETIIVRSSPNTSEVELIYMLSNGMGCDIVDTLIVPIDNVIIPEINVDGIDPTMVCGSVDLSVTSQEDDATYEWSLDPNFDEIVATGSMVTIDLPDANNTVYVRASHPDYCDTTIDSEEINTSNPDFNFDFDPINTCIGNTTILDIADNNPDQGLMVTFEPSDNITSELNQYPLTISVNDEGQESIVLAYTASNDAGCSISDSLTIPVENELDISIAIDSSSCDGMFGVFRAMSNASEVSYEWSLMDDFSSVLSTEMDIAISLPGGQPIYLRAFTDQCQSDTVSASLPDEGFMVDTDAPDRICDGDVTMITASHADTDFTIDWVDSDNIIAVDGATITIMAIEGQESIIVEYTATSAEGCVDMNTIEIPYGEIINPTPQTMVNCGTTSLSFSGGEGIEDGDILWDFGISSTDSDQSTLANPTFDFGAPGTYTVTLMPNRTTCRFETMMIDVVVPDSIGLMSDNATTISECGSEGGATLGATNPLGLPIVWVSNTGDTLAMGDSLNISSLQDITTITAISTDANGCSESIVFTVDTFNPDLMVTFPDNPAGQAACAGEDFAISIVGGEADWTYEWSPTTAIIAGQGTADVMANLNSSTDISVVITDPETGCFTIQTIPVDIIDLDVEVTADPDSEIFLGESVTISANSSGDIIDYSWDNGSTDMSQIVSPTETTTYTVTVTDVNGCTSTNQITITVIQPECDESDIFIPSAFSPNNDGENDVLFVRSNFVDELDFQIVNRWGQEIFRSTNQRDGWNGRFGGTGKELAPDTYAYCLKVVCVDDREYIITGHVTLYR